MIPIGRSIPWRRIDSVAETWQMRFKIDGLNYDGVAVISTANGTKISISWPTGTPRTIFENHIIVVDRSCNSPFTIKQAKIATEEWLTKRRVKVITERLANFK